MASEVQIKVELYDPDNLLKLLQKFYKHIRMPTELINTHKFVKIKGEPDDYELRIHFWEEIPTENLEHFVDFMNTEEQWIKEVVPNYLKLYEVFYLNNRDLTFFYSFHEFLLKMEPLQYLNLVGCNKRAIEIDKCLMLPHLRILDVTGSMLVESQKLAEDKIKSPLHTLRMSYSILPIYLHALTILKTIQKLNTQQIVTMVLDNGSLTHKKFCLDIPDNSYKNLQNLVDLNVSANGLTRLPTSLAQLHSLKYLDASNNELTHFPKYLFSLPKIEELKFSSNRLTKVDVDCHIPTTLKLLTLGDNRLSDFDFEAMPDDLWLTCYGNPFMSIPDEIINQDLEVIKKYLRDLKEKKAKVEPRVKIIMIGEKSAGKTTLADFIMRKENKIPKLPTTANTFEMMLKYDECSVNISIFDLPSIDTNDGTHRLFFSNNALYILAVNFMTYKQKHFYAHIGRWYDQLMSYSPQSTILVCLTRVNGMFRKAVEQALMDIKIDLHAYIEEKKQKGTVPTLVDCIPVYVFRNGWECTEIKDTIIRMYNEEKNLGKEVPRCWEKFEKLMQKDESQHCIAGEYIQELFTSARVQHFYPMMEYFQNKGKLFYLLDENCKLEAIFHRPFEVIATMRRVFSLNLQMLLAEKPGVIGKALVSVFWWRTSMEIDIRQMMKEMGETDRSIKNSIRMTEKGLLSRTILQLLMRYVCDVYENIELFIKLLVKFKFCYRLHANEAQGTQLSASNEDVFAFPCYQKNNIEDKELQAAFDIPDAKEEISYEMWFENLQICYDVCPQLIVLLHEKATTYKLVWRHGMIGVFHSAVVMLRYEELDNGMMRISVKAKVKSEEYMKSIDRSLSLIYRTVKQVVESTPGLKFDGAILICPHCKIGEDAVKISRTDEGVVFECNTSVDAKDLEMLFELNNRKGVLMKDVALFLRENEDIVRNWRFIAVHLDMTTRANAIYTEVCCQVGPDIQECAYRLLIEWGELMRDEHTIDYIVNFLIKILKKMAYGNIASRLEKFYFSQVRQKSE